MPQGPRPTLFQSTHPRGVRRLRLCAGRGRDRVSIHAPAWGATTGGNTMRVGRPVSIHAPAWGATSSSRPRVATWASFNPRTRVGCDFSFHVGTSTYHEFQSTHPRGVRPTTASVTRTNCKFQSTHPRGVRLAYKPAARGYRGVSIHAPAWGATSLQKRGGELCPVSIHAPAWGATVSMFYPVDSRD